MKGWLIRTQLNPIKDSGNSPFVKFNEQGDLVLPNRVKGEIESFNVRYLEGTPNTTIVDIHTSNGQTLQYTLERSNPVTDAASAQQLPQYEIVVVNLDETAKVARAVSGIFKDVPITTSHVVENYPPGVGRKVPGAAPTRGMD